MEIKGIEELIDRLSDKIEALIRERDELKLKVSRLNAYASARDKECVLTQREFNRTLEQIYEDSLRIDRGGSEIEAKLQNLNNRLMALVKNK